MSFDPKAALLASLTASYTVKETVDRPVKSPKVKADKAPSKSAATVKVETAKVADKSETDLQGRSERQREGDSGSTGMLPTMLLPGTYNARQFMIAWRNAKNRAEQVTALSGYKGYDVKGNFATQETMAKFHAKRETIGIEPGEDRSLTRSAQHTAQGFVAGLPNQQAKGIQDLLARERLAALTMSDWQKVSQDETKSPQERAAAMAQIELERERLQSIRQLLADRGALDVIQEG